ncbi:putative polyhydroxyalkanoic acid system protein (PHA_gran_rgn) [compost metagenome]|uniref:Putative polyhydroxyalkanoic acid system protein n=1 Tax=Pseudomonas jinjuensis TaxID=198616 RepID=A0A1H0IP99_9PSED|nr:polyhydroxyalkanoic acid system family protein [Pseudomonas jinjuensis]SDO32851.1 putative polyhydroxyalkanoic acid system protein [Pseudomonas jinjuensis]
MSHIRVERAHSLGLEAARAKADKLGERFASQYGLSHVWQGNTLVFQRSGVDGRIDVSEDRVVVDIKLGLLLSAMGGVLKSEIERGLDKALV